jgi:hypothetical protein
MTSCQDNQQSWGTAGTSTKPLEFLVQFIAALYGGHLATTGTVTLEEAPDYNGNGVVSVGEAFNYAYKFDRYGCYYKEFVEGITPTLDNSECPQLDDDSNGVGNPCYANRPNIGEYALPRDK